MVYSFHISLNKIGHKMGHKISQRLYAFEHYYILVYCYEIGNGVLKMVNKSSKNKNNRLVYMNIIKQGINK